MISSKLKRVDSEANQSQIIYFTEDDMHSLIVEDESPILTIIANDIYNSSDKDFTFGLTGNSSTGNLISWDYEIVSVLDGGTTLSHTNGNTLSLPEKNLNGSVRITVKTDKTETSRVVNFRKFGVIEHIILNHYVNPNIVEYNETSAVLYYTGVTIQEGVEIERVETSMTISWVDDEDGGINTTNNMLDRTGSSITNFYDNIIEWNCIQKPKKVEGYTVLYGNNETTYDGDKKIITLTEEDGKQTNSDMVANGWSPIAMYGGEITDNDGTKRDLWISLKKATNGFYTNSEGSFDTLADGAYRSSSSSNSNMSWGFNTTMINTNTAITDGYDMNVKVWDMMFEDEVHKNYLLSLEKMWPKSANATGSNAYNSSSTELYAYHLGGSHTNNRRDYSPLFFATYRLETPDGKMGKFYVPSVLEAISFTKGKAISNWDKVKKLVGYESYFGTSTHTCMDYSYLSPYIVDTGTIKTNTNKGSGTQTTLLYHYDLKGEYHPLTFKSLNITAENVYGHNTTTKIKYSFITDGVYDNGEIGKDIEITGTTVSNNFGMNPSNIEKREIIVSYSDNNLTASTTIIQDEYKESMQTVISDNDEWIAANFEKNGYEVYMSNKSKGKNYYYDVMKIIFYGQPDFTIYINACAEQHDYVIAYELDYDIDIAGSMGGKSYKPSNSSSSYDPTGSYWKKINYPNDGGEHSVTIIYVKNYTDSYYDDRGYVAIPKL